MSEADKVVIVGTMASASLASFFEYAATKVLPEVKVVTSGNGADARIVALTNSHQSPIVRLASITFLIFISVTSTVDAYAAPLAFINSLITEFVDRYPKKIKNNMQAFEKYTNGMDVWHKK